MTTPPKSEPPNEPPSREAVEAALEYMHEPIIRSDEMEDCARILAAEVQRLMEWQKRAIEEMDEHGGTMAFTCCNDLDL